MNVVDVHAFHVTPKSFQTPKKTEASRLTSKMECLFFSLSMRKIAIKLNRNVLQIKMYHNLEVLTERIIF